jgi:hypothetical protein
MFCHDDTHYYPIFSDIRNTLDHSYLVWEKRMLGGDSSGRPPADLWPFYKELLATVEAAVVLKQPGIRYVLLLFFNSLDNNYCADPKHPMYRTS